MNTQFRSALLVASFLPLIGCQSAAPQFTPQDEAAVRGLFDASLRDPD